MEKEGEMFQRVGYINKFSETRSERSLGGRMSCMKGKRNREKGKKSGSHPRALKMVGQTDNIRDPIPLEKRALIQCIR